MSNLQTINLADHVNAAVDKINENFAGLDSAVSNITINIDSADITNIINNTLDSDYFITVFDSDYFQQFIINPDVSYLENDISANASALLALTARIDVTDSSVLVLSQAQLATQAQLEGLVLGGIDSDVLAAAIANANTTLISRIEANSDSISILAGSIDSVNSQLILLDQNTDSRIEANATAINSLTTRIDATDSDLSIISASVTQLDVSLTQLINDGITISDSDVIEAVGGALSSLDTRILANENGVTVISESLDSVSARLVALDSSTNARIEAEADAREALTATVSTLDGRVTSEASRITNLTASVDSNFATVNETLTTLANDSGSSAVYALNLDVNNHIAGIKLENSGDSAQFIITADTFKIVNSSNNAIQPFTVDANDVFLSNATVTGGLNVTTSDNDGSMTVTGNLITISDANGTTRVKLGKLTP